MPTLAVENLTRRLAAGEVIRNDGGLGTELPYHDYELPEGEWSAHALLTDGGPRVIKDIHAEYIRAGAEIIITDTFRTQNLDGELADIATFRATEAAREAREETGTLDRVVIAGSVGPVGDCYTPSDTPDQDVLAARHYPHASRLFAGGVDIFLPETMITAREVSLAAQAGRAAGFDSIAVSFCTDPDGINLHGGEDTLESGVEAVLPFDPIFIGVNCVQPDVATKAIRHLVENLQVTVPIAVYAQGGHDLSNPQAGFTPEQFQNYYVEMSRQWVDLGAKIIGGCCGVRPSYITQIREHIADTSRTA